ncbi:hypothetical protein D3P06_04475 [Paracoccus aestuarii]|uniref:Peptidase metallopeptidase domain-containing protein n=1 Tax=Paracoccus aestuarii TaxID=453842 RepID=A0A418ZZY5_9RHOB|nr:M10 family metallopeptidase C-terminal domain-containing protein [Paracoccus aestuarii]RJL06167.1 hypothetical protein D3P06_04475 [Paracoccus aestuarii]WCQ98345.1 M10 family metallopeptidase C-terminal domain-containing protein [Paracoccus aestuarii]
MCTICTAMRPFDPKCALTGLEGTEIDTLRATIRDNAGTSPGIWTTHRMAPGDVFHGNLNGSLDQDWVGIRLEAGRSYEIQLTGQTLADPLLRLYDSNGRWLATDDDGGPGLNSRLVFTPGQSGLYFLEADGFGGSAGSYELSARIIQPTAPLRPASMEVMADFLVNGYWSTQGQGARAFDTRFDNVITVNISELSGRANIMARAAMEAWASVADIRFRETGSNADIRFTEGMNGAWASSTMFGSRLVSSTINVSASWLDREGSQIGTYGFQTYLHEIGHALGLGHMGAYNGSGTFASSARFVNDSWQASVMSYFSQAGNPNVQASFAMAGTLMPADIMAIQRLYGAAGNRSLTAGDTIYGLGHNLGGSWLGRIFDAQSGLDRPGIKDARAIALTIWDSGGRDTINLSHDSAAQRVDLRMGTSSDVFGLRGNLQIAPGTMIENYFAGSGNDVVRGNTANNLLRGGPGNDLIHGLAGNDTIHGGAGHDQLFGGAGDDRLFGNQGNDRLSDPSGNNFMSGGLGNDTLIAGSGRDTLNGDDGNDSIMGGGGADMIHGGAGNDTLIGGPGNDWIDGGSGNDRMMGGLGRDTLRGGTGDDTIFGGEGNDVLFGGHGRDRLEGGAGNDILRGQQGNDRLMGQGGNDTLIGGLGSDTMTGGLGADVFRFLTAADSTMANPDLITDFRPGEDLLDFRALNLSYAGTGAHTGARSLRWDHDGGQTRILVDVNGDQRPDMMVRLAGRLDLDADDFIF